MDSGAVIAEATVSTMDSGSMPLRRPVLVDPELAYAR